VGRGRPPRIKTCVNTAVMGSCGYAGRCGCLGTSSELARSGCSDSNLAQTHLAQPSEVPACARVPAGSTGVSKTRMAVAGCRVVAATGRRGEPSPLSTLTVARSSRMCYRPRMATSRQQHTCIGPAAYATNGMKLSRALAPVLLALFPSWFSGQSTGFLKRAGRVPEGGAVRG
jgi:hypothetical protein